MAKLGATLLLWALVRLTCANPFDRDQQSTSGDVTWYPVVDRWFSNSGKR